MTDDTRPIEETMIIPRLAARLDAAEAQEAALRARYETTPLPRGYDTQALHRIPEDDARPIDHTMIIPQVDILAEEIQLDYETTPPPRNSATQTQVLHRLPEAVEEVLSPADAPWFAGAMENRDQAYQEAMGRPELNVLGLGDGLRPAGLYDSMARTAGAYAHQSLILRLTEARRMDRMTGYGRGYDTERLSYATHLLTGPALLRIVSTLLPAAPIRGDAVELALSWPRFAANPWTRLDFIGELARSPVSSLLRVTLLNLVRSLTMGTPALGRTGNLVLNAMGQVGSFDATGGAEMVDLVVSCLIPPIAAGEVRG